tara:strand:+ start:165 stop:1085 length:921 start_codon:yes stop_codon:yes gene_type:complete
MNNLNENVNTNQFTSSLTNSDNNILSETSNFDKFVKVSKDFLDSNNIITKFAFLLFIIIIFVSLLRVGTNILVWFLSPSKDPILINGLNNAKQYVNIPQDPSLDNSITISRSVNEKQGMEFTWSIWMYIDDFNGYKKEQYKHVFHKGNDNIILEGDNNGKIFPINAPGLYITPHVNNLEIIMNTFDEINDTIIIKNIPIHKWINVIIRLNNQQQLDVYINGVLTKRHSLKGVARQNYGNVYSSMNGGFSGYTSDLRYFDNAISLGKINQIISKGPNLKVYNSGKSNNIVKSKPQYLSSKWYFNEAN